MFFSGNFGHSFISWRICFVALAQESDAVAKDMALLSDGDQNPKQNETPVHGVRLLIT